MKSGRKRKKKTRPKASKRRKKALNELLGVFGPELF